VWLGAPSSPGQGGREARLHEGNAELASLLGDTLCLPCQVPPTREGSPYYTAPPGSLLVLNRPLTIPARKGEIYIQGGRVHESTGYVSFRGVDQYYPNCRLELRSRNPLPVIIEPEELVITRVDRDDRFVSRRVMVAAADASPLMAGTDPMVMSTVFYLYSARQPGLWRLTCAHWEAAYEAEHLTLVQIRRTLGEVFTLKLIN
jgi:hypothetical protein